jgi:hypothetical protein
MELRWSSDGAATVDEPYENLFSKEIKMLG